MTQRRTNVEPRCEMFDPVFVIEEEYYIRFEGVTNTSSSSVNNSSDNSNNGKMVKKFTPSQVTIEGKKNGDKEVTESSRPPPDPWRQNKLNAWSPVYTPQAVLPSMMIIGIAFIPVGIGLLYTSYHVEEFKLDYTDCLSSHHDSLTCASIIEIPDEFESNLDETTRRINKKRCFCNVKFRLNHDFERDVFFYYAMSGYYQSLRRYATSYDDRQLMGSSSIHLSYSCKPFKKTIDPKDGIEKPIAPCGAIANSLFNDTFSLYYFLGTDDQVSNTDENDHDVTFNPVGMSPLDVHYQQSNKTHSLIPISILESDISWPSDRLYKYKNPEDFSPFTKPINWIKDVFMLDPGNPSNNGYLNEHLIVWMRTAAFPSFRKLWGRIYHDGITEDKLPKGYYLISIEYNYPVIAFDGRKSIIISNTSWFGGREFFLGIGYVAFGSFTVVLSMTLFVIQRLYGFTTKEMVDIHVYTPYIDDERKRLVYRERKRTLASIFAPQY